VLSQTLAGCWPGPLARFPVPDLIPLACGSIHCYCFYICTHSGPHFHMHNIQLAYHHAQQQNSLYVWGYGRSGRVLATYSIRLFPLPPPVRHRVPSDFNWTLLRFCTATSSQFALRPLRNQALSLAENSLSSSKDISTAVDNKTHSPRLFTIV